MLKKFRLEVECDDPERVIAELDKYEHALHVAEAERFCLGTADDWVVLPWTATRDRRRFHVTSPDLGREITEEVIERADDGGRYVGRRVVRFRRLDTRQVEIQSGLDAVYEHYSPRWTDHCEPQGIVFQHRQSSAVSP